MAVVVESLSLVLECLDPEEPSWQPLVLCARAVCPRLRELVSASCHTWVMKASERHDSQWQAAFWSSLGARLHAICRTFPQAQVAIKYHGMLLQPSEREALLGLLPTFPIARLALLNTSLTASKVAPILKALPGCSGLVELDLSSNCLGQEGGLAVAGLLPQMEVLASLKLKSNMLFAKGVDGVLRAGLAGQRLELLDLSDNLAGKESDERRSMVETAQLRGMRLML